MMKPKKSAGKKAGRRRPPSMKFLGEVFTEIAGGQYYEAGIEPGGKLQLEREPGNEHDENAIRVENVRFQQAGYVPRRISSWLAPLIDSGEVWVEGRAADSPGAEKSARDFILIELYLHGKGRRILRRSSDPKDGMEALHQAVLAVWAEVDKWTDAEAVTVLANRLKALAAEDLLPRTRMLLSLFKYRAWKMRRLAEERAIEGVRGSIKDIKVGKAIFYRNLTVFPLMSNNGGKPDYILLEDAIAGEKAEVREVSESGSIPELLVENRAAMPILIPEGEILVGAKQDRTVNITILIREKTERVIPVSCVEQGRWNWTTPHFAASNYATPGLRGGKIASSQANRRATGRAFSDQKQVWQDVSMSINAAGAHSETDSINDAFKAAKKRTGEYRKNLVLPKEAAGVIVAIGGEVIGMDLFDSPRTLRKIWPRLSESYFFEGAYREKAKKTARAAAAEFLKSLPEAVKLAPDGSEYGRELEFSEGDYIGSGLWYNSRLCHLSAFRAKRD